MMEKEKTKTTFRRHAPRVGEDGVEVLREAGLSDAHIEAPSCCLDTHNVRRPIWRTLNSMPTPGPFSTC